MPSPNPRKPPGVAMPPGMGKKTLKRAAALAAAAQQLPPQPVPLQQQVQPPPQPYGAGKGGAAVEGHPKKRPDGTYTTGYCGTQLCYEYGRNANGCTHIGPCKGVPQRLHQCELCLGLHRSIKCTVPGNAGWQPPPQDTLYERCNLGGNYGCTHKEDHVVCPFSRHLAHVPSFGNNDDVAVL